MSDEILRRSAFHAVFESGVLCGSHDEMFAIANCASVDLPLPAVNVYLSQLEKESRVHQCSSLFYIEDYKDARPISLHCIHCIECDQISINIFCLHFELHPDRSQNAKENR